jgi:hypothetical protein
MRVHNGNSKKRARPRCMPVTAKGLAPALVGQRDLSAQIWARWQQSEAAADKEKPAITAMGPPA